MSLPDSMWMRQRSGPVPFYEKEEMCRRLSSPQRVERRVKKQKRVLTVLPAFYSARLDDTSVNSENIKQEIRKYLFNYRNDLTKRPHTKNKLSIKKMDTSRLEDVVRIVLSFPFHNPIPSFVAVMFSPFLFRSFAR